MRMQNSSLIAAVVVLSGSAALAQSTRIVKPTAPRTTFTLQTTPDPTVKKAFRDLFAPSTQAPDQKARDPKNELLLKALANMPQRPQPRVICGMQVIPADPKIDPKMRVLTPDPDAKHTMRVVEPPICQPNER